MKYAQDTQVSVERSKAEIETICQRYGATGFISGWMQDQAMVTFEMRSRRIRFILPLPDRKDKQFAMTKHKSQWRRQPVDEATAYKNWEQACRQRWRALALAIKAKLEAVESGISQFDDEFLSFIVLPSGLTIGQTLQPDMDQIAATGKMPMLLPAPPSN